MKMRYFAVLLLSAVLLTGCGGGTSTKNGTTAVTTTTESKEQNRPCNDLRVRRIIPVLWMILLCITLCM